MKSEEEGRDEDIYLITDSNDINGLDYLPDHEDEEAFIPLENVSPRLSDRLREFFAREFLRHAQKQPDFMGVVIETTDLRVASFPSESGKRLRLTSRITGATYWYVEWDGLEETARDWIEQQVAPAQADIVLHDEALGRRFSTGK